jgi:hypothetical protein
MRRQGELRRRPRTLEQARAETEAALRGDKLPPLNKPKKAPGHKEDDEQRELFKWAHGTDQRPGADLLYPALKLLHAIPNGGRRDKFEAARMVGQGVKPGVLDLDLPVRGSYAQRDKNPEPGEESFTITHYLGLRIELKRVWETGKSNQYPSPDQKWWMSALQDAGHCVCLCYGKDQAVAAIEAYLTGRRVPFQWKRP